jgi:lipopolysaccharide export system protein LptC
MMKSLIQRFYRFHQQLPAPWLLAVLLLIGYLAFSLRSADAPVVISADSSSYPQFYIKNVETREFDENGQLSFALKSPLVTHYQVNSDAASEADYTLFNLPSVLFQREAGDAPWETTAALGRSEDDNAQLLLSGNVMIKQFSETQGLLTITTDELRIRTREQFAHTDKAVKMTSPKGQMEAIGMDADLANSQLQLRSQVKAFYEPR